MSDNSQPAMDHIHNLAASIGGRGSCTPQERQAAEYAVACMRGGGVQSVRLETFRSSSSTYQPIALAFTVALLGTLAAWLFGNWGLAAAAALNALGAWGMFAESDFTPNWTRWLAARSTSQNAVGVLSPSRFVKRCAVLCSHLDTHRTPVFYSNQIWYRLFGKLVSVAFASMPLNAVVYALAALTGWGGLRWVGAFFACLQLIALALCLHADHTPFSPGANDNASGAGAVLALAKRLRDDPLQHTEVWLLFTGCEEVGTHGMGAFLDAHSAELGDDAVYIILDEVGRGQLNYLTADGLIRKRPTHPAALKLARQAAAALPELEVLEKVGLAYTDAAAATRRGRIALTINTLPPPGDVNAIHWHRMTDTIEHIDPRALAATLRFTWQVLLEADKAAQTPNQF
ncbi:MAG: M20/M25/M40 family metallo-hydrolase [Anaerolineaceae bacterium]|nr:M20/M25/M40 family metallo-hydrolase [Anaerolineaceae bacterium]